MPNAEKIELTTPNLTQPNQEFGIPDIWHWVVVRHSAVVRHSNVRQSVVRHSDIAPNCYLKLGRRSNQHQSLLVLDSWHERKVCLSLYP
jgi:hypothetical protein